MAECPHKITKAILWILYRSHLKETKGRGLRWRTRSFIIRYTSGCSPLSSKEKDIE